MPLLMGILNLTPDSFSDGGTDRSVDDAIARALRLEDAGAAILDVGGESTRPYSDAIGIEEELRRVVPVLEGLQGRLRIPVSIDTTKAEVAAAAIELGAEIINDVSGMEQDPAMLAIAVRSQTGVCIMHMQGTPQTMQKAPEYREVVGDVKNYLADRCTVLQQAGISPDRICIDPGIGFGKTHAHNLRLLASMEAFHDLGKVILVGHSRKGMIAHWMRNKEASREPGTMAISLAMATKGVQILRVHDVEANYHALQVFCAIEGDC